MSYKLLEGVLNRSSKYNASNHFLSQTSRYIRTYHSNLVIFPCSYCFSTFSNRASSFVLFTFPGVEVCGDPSPSTLGHIAQWYNPVWSLLCLLKNAKQEPPTVRKVRTNSFSLVVVSNSREKSVPDTARFGCCMSHTVRTNRESKGRSWYFNGKVTHSFQLNFGQDGAEIYTFGIRKKHFDKWYAFGKEVFHLNK